jgi:homoserine kinase
MSNFIRVFAPATISNVGPGFDLMGFAIDQPGDIIRMAKNKDNFIHIFNETDCCLPEDPEENVSSVGIQALLDQLKVQQGFDLIFEQKINPGSGIGSSAASAAAAVFGANALLGSPLNINQLLPAVLKGEFVASKSLHADNAAPALLGGFILIRDYHPIDLISLPYPADLICVVIHPDIEIKTSESRKLIPKEIKLETALEQCGNIAGLVTGLTTSNYELIGRSIKDVFAEPYRSATIPGYAELKEELLCMGAIGAGISGSGPSIFAFCRDSGMAGKIAEKMESIYSEKNIQSKVYISKISSSGTRVL